MHNCRKTWVVSLAFLGSALAHEARADVVVIVSAKSSANTLTSEQVSQVYLGKSTEMKPIDNNESKSLVRQQFYAKISGKDEAQVKAIWAKLVFTGKAAPPKALKSSAEVVKAVAADSSAIGYVDKSAVDSSVKVIYEIK